MTAKGYEVHLEIFEGPLDLLLYLIRKNDLDIQNVAISQITQEYLSYLELMKELNLDVAGDFLVMASTLMQIKARSLLPSVVSGEESEGPNPEAEFRQKLMEYEKYKNAGGFLHDRAQRFGDIFYRGAPRFEERDKGLDIRIFDLLSTLREVLDRAEDDGRIVPGEEFPLETKVKKILDLLETKPYVLLRDIFEGETRRLAIVTCFIALLELIKTQRVFARQEEAFGEVLIYKKEEPEESMPAVWPGAGEDQDGQAGEGDEKGET